MSKIILLKNLYSKQSILYTIDLYFENKEYEITEDEKNFVLIFNNIKDKELKFIKQELNFNSLRFEIADKNKKLRETIIAQALWSINID